MSLKINESAQENAKSLSDLFGDNLTEAGRADLEWAAKCAAQDLAVAIFSEGETVKNYIPDNADQRSSYREKDVTALQHTYSGNFGNWRIFEPASKYTVSIDQLARAVQLNTNLRKTSYPERGFRKPKPVYARLGNLLRTEEDHEQVEQLFGCFVYGLENLSLQHTFLENQLKLKELREITGIKSLTVTLQESGVPDLIKVVPKKLKPDQKKILPKMKRTLLIGNKIK